MAFDTIAIVGVGLIGGSVGLAVKQRGLARRVVGIGRNASSLARGRRAGAIDMGTVDLARGVAEAELVVLCTPVDHIAAQARAASASCPAGAILTDTGSTKARIVASLDGELPGGSVFVGGHPLAGSEKRGVEHARGNLFEDRICVVTRTRHTPRQPLRVVQQLWRALGARVVTMSPEAHDRALAYTSHLPHLAAAGLSVALPGKYNALVASGFRDTTRIAASDPDLWTAIFLENAPSLLEALAKYETALRQFRQALQARDDQTLRSLWARSKANRDSVAEPEHAAARLPRRAAKPRTS